LASTLFELSDARSAFPCFDEPEFKATFNLQIEHSSAYSAVSNTPGKVKEIRDGFSTTSFDVTPKMPPYLLAFLVSDYEFISNADTVGNGEVLHTLV
jgi:aminopeptidase N